MRILILLLISLQGFGQLLPVVNSRSRVPQAAPPAETFLDSAQFSFSVSLSKTNYTQANGDPAGAIRTYSGSYGIGINTVSTAKWISGTTGMSNDGGQAGSIWLGYAFSQLPVGTIADSNLVITGLVPGAQYEVKIFASRSSAAVAAAQRYTSYIVRDAVKDTTILDYDIKGNVSNYANLGIRTATNAGRITIRCNPRSPADGSHVFAYIGLLEIRRYPR